MVQTVVKCLVHRWRTDMNVVWSRFYCPHHSCIIRKLDFSCSLSLGQTQCALEVPPPVNVDCMCLHVMSVLSCLPVSVRLPVWAGDRFARVRDAVPLLHGPALRPGAPLCPPHPAAVHPKRDQHSEIHQVRFPCCGWVGGWVGVARPTHPVVCPHLYGLEMDITVQTVSVPIIIFILDLK